MSERVQLDWPLRSWMLTSMSKNEGIQVQNAWIDEINSKSTEYWEEFVQNS